MTSIKLLLTIVETISAEIIMMLEVLIIGIVLLFMKERFMTISVIV